MRKPSGKSTKREVYLDHASLTPVDSRVAAEMAGFSAAGFSNPSSIHAGGVRAKKALDAARASCAQFLHAHPDEIIFTGSGTEANNIALLGAVEYALQKAAGKSYKDIHIIVSAIEHPSVLTAAQALAARGARVDFAPVTPDGIVDLEIFKKLLTPSTVLVSVMMVNNEIGTIQPIAEIAKIIRDFKKGKIDVPEDFSYPLLHTDACQALLYAEINLEKLGVDMLTADSHKVYGPRGVGMLYVRRSAREFISPIMFGGGQEDGLRPGTENLPGIAGFAKALELVADENRAKNPGETGRVIRLRDYCIKRLETMILGLIVNGSWGDAEKNSRRIANNVNISIPGIDHEFLLLQLDARGISCSTKSSCLRDEDESYVIRALRGNQKGGKNADKMRQALRFTLGRATTKKDMDFLVKSIDECIHL